MKRTLFVIFALLMSVSLFATKLYLPMEDNELTDDLDAANKSATKQKYLQKETGTVFIVDACFTGGKVTTTPSSIIDFESDEAGKAYPIVAWYHSEDINALVENNPAGGGKSLHVTTSNYNAYPKFHIILPDNKKLNDIKKVTFNIFLVENGSSQYSHKDIDYFIVETGVAFTPNAVTGRINNLIRAEATGVWITKEFPLEISGELLEYNDFDFCIGMNFSNCNYYIDNITFSDASSAVASTSSSPNKTK